MDKIIRVLACIFLSLTLATASSAGEAVFYYHTDPAGTPLAMTDAGGRVVWQADYMPFGEEDLITGTIENDHKFVGKEQDSETGLYYFGARYMEPAIGRFMSPDPVGAIDSHSGSINQRILLNPQRLNYYAYGLNNPYKYIDSDGNQANIVGDPAVPTLQRIPRPSDIIRWLNGDPAIQEAGKGIGNIGDTVSDAAEKAEKTGLRRPYIRKDVRKEVEERAPKTADGRFIDPNTGEPIEGKPDLAHRYGNEFHREKAKAEAEGLSQKEFNDRMNNPDLYQLEKPSSNRSHRFEKKP